MIFKKKGLTNIVKNESGSMLAGSLLAICGIGLTVAGSLMLLDDSKYKYLAAIANYAAATIAYITAYKVLSE